MDNRIHTVIFDLDGTLSDSAILTIEALKTVAPNCGLPMLSIEDIRLAMGNAIPEFYYILFPDHDRDIVHNAGMLVDQEELRLLPSLSGRLLFDGCRELLERLKEKGIRLCIASTGDKDHVFPIMNETGITRFFDTISCGRPDKAEMRREMTEGSDKKGCVMLGDMKKDCEGARANGIVSVGACYGYCKKEHSDFDYYISAPLELLDILKI